MQLEADEGEEQGIDEEDEDLPERVPGEAGLDRGQLRREPAHVDTDRDGREHA